MAGWLTAGAIGGGIMLDILLRDWVREKMGLDTDEQLQRAQAGRERKGRLAEQQALATLASREATAQDRENVRLGGIGDDPMFMALMGVGGMGGGPGAGAGSPGNRVNPGPPVNPYDMLVQSGNLTGKRGDLLPLQLGEMLSSRRRT